MLPDKSIAHLVKYYYSWKKTRTRTSLMDRQARKLQIAREQHGYSEGSTPLLNSNETGDGNSAAGTNATSGTTTTGGFASTGSRISDLTILSDDEEKEAGPASSGSMLGAATPKPRCFNCGIL